MRSRGFRRRFMIGTPRNGQITASVSADGVASGGRSACVQRRHEHGGSANWLVFLMAADGQTLWTEISDRMFQNIDGLAPGVRSVAQAVAGALPALLIVLFAGLLAFIALACGADRRRFALDYADRFVGLAGVLVGISPSAGSSANFAPESGVEQSGSG